MALNYHQPGPESSSDCRWLDNRKELLSWEETLNDPVLQKFFRKNINFKHSDSYKSNRDTDTVFVKTQQKALLGVPFSDFGISIKEKKKLNKKRQKELRRAKAQAKDAEVQERLENDMTKVLDFEVNYMKSMKLPFYQSYKLISSLNDIDRLLRDFLLTEKQEQLSLCAMDSSVRSIVKDLLAVYNLNYSIMDRKDQKHLTLYKTKSSRIPQWDKKQVQFDQFHPSGVVFNSPPLLKVIHALHTKWIKSCHRELDYHKFSELRFIESRNEDLEPVNNLAVTIVGKDAPQLTESNIGFRMLRKMGWKPDESDAAEGLESTPLPFRVVIRHGKSGLGYNFESKKGALSF